MGVVHKLVTSTKEVFCFKTETANSAETEQRQDAKQQILIRPILFLYYEKSLVSSNLNSKLLSFHCAYPNVHKM